jgi:hypothetical protein
MSFNAVRLSNIHTVRKVNSNIGVSVSQRCDGYSILWDLIFNAGGFTVR